MLLRDQGGPSGMPHKVSFNWKRTEAFSRLLPIRIVAGYRHGRPAIQICPMLKLQSDGFGMSIKRKEKYIYDRRRQHLAWCLSRTRTTVNYLFRDAIYGG